jgi:hypothetical protein
MARSFGKKLELINQLGGDLNFSHLLALKQLGMTGAIIYEYGLALKLREIQKLRPDLICILPPAPKENTWHGQKPYFVCFRTSLGETFYKML